MRLRAIVLVSFGSGSVFHTNGPALAGPFCNSGNPGTRKGMEAPREHAGGFLPEQPKRRMFESVFARIVATAGIVGIGTALGAILGAVDAATWVIALVVSCVSVVLAAVLWRSRVL